MISILKGVHLVELVSTLVRVTSVLGGRAIEWLGNRFRGNRVHLIHVSVHG